MTICRFCDEKSQKRRDSHMSCGSQAQTLFSRLVRYR